MTSHFLYAYVLLGNSLWLKSNGMAISEQITFHQSRAIRVKTCRVKRYAAPANAFTFDLALSDDVFAPHIILSTLLFRFATLSVLLTMQWCPILLTTRSPSHSGRNHSIGLYTGYFSNIPHYFGGGRKRRFEDFRSFETKIWKKLNKMKRKGQRQTLDASTGTSVSFFLELCSQKRHVLSE